MLELTGNLVPLPTPFTDDGSSISEVRLERCIRRFLDQGASGFVVASEAGEFGALTISERKHLFELVAHNVPAGTPLAAHVSTLGTMSSLDLAQHAANCGYRAAVVMPPYYGFFSDAEISTFMLTLARHAHLPMIVVDPLARLDGDLAADIAQIPGVKTAIPVFDSDQSDAACFERSTSDEFACGRLFSFPLAMFGSVWKGHDESSYLALREILHIFGAARVAKFAADWIGLDLGPTRGPLQPLPAAAREALHRALCVAA